MQSASTRRIVTALAARERIGACEGFLQATAGQEILIVAPTRMAADEMARNFCLGRTGSFGMHRFSLGALAVEIASPRLAASGKSVLAGVAVDALAARAVEESRAKSGLRWFEPVADAPGFFRALASTLTELRLDAVDVDALRRTQPAGFDLAQLLSAYDQYLTD